MLLDPDNPSGIIYNEQLKKINDRVGDALKRQLIEYMNNFFLERKDVHLRFELGEPYENGTHARINQVIYRVNTLFEEVFEQESAIYIYIKDWETKEDIMFGNTTPNYVYDLLKGHKFEDDTLFELEEDEDDEGIKIQIQHEYKVRILNGLISSFPYKEILKGICHYEQGKEPSIGQSIYFVNIEKDLVFNMYDDRGCIVCSKDKEILKPIYIKHNTWLVDYWREYFNSIFGE